MGQLARIGLVAKGKLGAALDRAEDPREVLEYAYQRQQRELVQVRRSLVDVATAKTQLALHARKLREGIPAHVEQARHAVELGREDLAREALQRKHAALAELESLDRQVTEVGEEEARLAAAQRRLALRSDELRSRKGVVSARYASAQARVRAAAALTGISGELAELHLALGRAEEKTDRLRARADALDALIEGEELGHELGELLTAQAAEAELAALMRTRGAIECR